MTTRRVVAFDPGPTWTGFAVLDVIGNRPSYVEAGRIESTVDAVCSVLVEHGAGHVARIAVEVVDARYGIAGPRGAALIDTNGIAVGIVWACRMLRYDVDPMPAPVWRKALLGKATAGDDAVKLAVQRLVVGWPTRSNAHARDAAGLGVVASWRVRARAA
jgi:Holliday junction resolvasome RuvABC endonuclease subunit